MPEPEPGAHTIADLYAKPDAKPCTYDHVIALTYTAPDSKPLAYPDWYALAIAHGYRPCPDSYPTPGLPA